MSDKQYPPLPPPAVTGEQLVLDRHGGHVRKYKFFSTRQMRAYVDADRAQRLPLTEGWIEKNIGTSTSMLSAVVRHVVRKVEAAHGISTPPRPDATTEGEDK